MTTTTTPAPLETQIKPAPEVSRHAHTLWRTQNIPDQEGKFHPLSLEQITGAMEAIRREAMGHADEIAKTLEVYRLSAQGARANLGEIEEDRRGLLAKVAELEAERDRLKAGCHDRDALLKIREEDRTSLAVKLHDARKELGEALKDASQQRENARKLQEDLAGVVKELAQVKEHRGEVMAERNRAQDRVHELEHPQSTGARALAQALARIQTLENDLQTVKNANEVLIDHTKTLEDRVDDRDDEIDKIGKAYGKLAAKHARATEIIKGLKTRVPVRRNERLAAELGNTQARLHETEEALAGEVNAHRETIAALNATQDRQGDLELQLKAAIDTAANYAAKIAVGAVEKKAMEKSLEILAENFHQVDQKALEDRLELEKEKQYSEDRSNRLLQTRGQLREAQEDKTALEARVNELEAHANGLQALIDARYTADRAAEEEALARAGVEKIHGDYCYIPNNDTAAS